MPDKMNVKFSNPTEILLPSGERENTLKKTFISSA